MQDTLYQLASLLPGDPQVFWYGAFASLLAGLGTSLGALAIFLIRRPSQRTLVGMISGAAGVMLAATFFSLLEPAIDHAEAHAVHSGSGVTIVLVGMFLGAAMLFGIHRSSPHEHFEQGREGPANSHVSRLWLFVIAITLHNFPEGMAVGVGFAGEDVANGISLGLGIGIQNIPEGLAVAVSLLAIGYSKPAAFAVASLTGLVEPIGGAIGAAVVWLAEPAIPVILGIAAGAMLFIISDEIIPETHKGEYKTLATFSLLIGVALMLFLDVLLT
ncbi:ZIP family metal transporter [Povalibacter sp.]|uniref:ZIP family metal transporter n=1 Tax=Povalibacter sp. TaxID=1962978 RepID=UPI002F3EBDF8